MKKGNIISRALNNKASAKLRGRLASLARRGCDAIPQQRRLTVVAVMLSAFVLVAFLVFGNACYRMGRGHSAAALPETGRIEGVALPAFNDSDSLKIKEYKLPSCNESERSENANI